MRTPRPHPRRFSSAGTGGRPPGRRRLRLPRRTARLRLAVLYGSAFLVCSAVVLGVVAYVFFGSGRYQRPGGGSNGTVSEAAMNTRIPIADVQQAGSYDIIQQFRVPAADLQRAGSYYVYKVTIPAKAPAFTPAELAELAKLDAKGITQVNIDVRDFLIVCALILAGIAVAAAAIGWLIAGRVLRPLSTITVAARRIAASSLHERLALHGPDDELKELADTLDNLFARLEASFETQRRFAANASHELRTPLTRERTLLQVTLADPASTAETWRAVSRELLASNAEQERLIEALLTLAGSEADPGESEPLDLAAISGTALAAAGPAISRLGLNVQADLQPAALEGDPLLVQHLVTNLIDNAVQYNLPGGDVQVTSRTSGGHAILSVANSGPVIPAAEVDRLFQAFQRLGSRRARRDGGHGLGLSIVRAIATAHGATVEARARPEGGLAVDVTFLAPVPVIQPGGVWWPPDG
jgi:signal transduction histidine kinase